MSYWKTQVLSTAWNKINRRIRGRRFGTVSKKYIGKFLPECPIIVEAGAHIGIDTLEMADTWPRGSIHAFEPVPDLYNQLKFNTEKRKNVFCYPFALSHIAGFSKMYISSGSSNGSSSLLPPKEHLTRYPNVAFIDTIEVETITLDAWAENQGFPHPDLLWMDVQGHELSLLKGAENSLESIQAIYGEVNLVEAYEGGALYPELRTWLEDFGFRVEREALPWPEGGNVLFIKA